MLKASRDQVENLMQVVDKMQHQQTKLLVTLQAEKKNISAVSCTGWDILWVFLGRCASPAETNPKMLIGRKVVVEMEIKLVLDPKGRSFGHDNWRSTTVHLIGLR